MISWTPVVFRTARGEVVGAEGDATDVGGAIIGELVESGLTKIIYITIS